MDVQQEAYYKKLMEDITDAFVYYVEPMGFLDLAPQFGLEISAMTKTEVFTKVRKRDSDPAALQLLQSIVENDDWFDKTVNVFRKMRQNNAATELTGIKDKLDAVYKANQGTEDLQVPGPKKTT